jgi:ParE toxin of type II toxin-antitoxin system, parDE
VGASSFERLAARARKTPHAFMLEVLARDAERSELRERFAADTEQSEQEALSGGKTCALGSMELLADHPLLGREAEEGRREPLLSRGRYGYIAKYRWLRVEDVVLILAVRHQREAGYAED